jgi:hypothetical protein
VRTPLAAAVTVRTPAELRRFGCTVGGVFLMLAAVSWWRGHVQPPLVLGVVGALLVLPALVFPSALGPVERAWMALAAVMGAINTRILLTVVYVLVVTPIAWLRRLGGDPLDRALGTDVRSHWVPRERGPVDAESYRKQF